jgi:mono/diheme cytochrome c family protein
MTSNRRHMANRAVVSIVASRLARAFFLSAVLIVGTAQRSQAQDGPDEAILGQGKSDFQWHCTMCHGADGTGGGPMAKMLIKRPADLTTISKQKGGTFPFWEVYRIIAGNEEVPGHETFQMPNFWRRFSKDERDWGFLPPQVRVLVLTHYVESLQKK